MMDQKALFFVVSIILVSVSQIFALTGKELYFARSCPSCHGADGNKTMSNYTPRIGGQNPKFVRNAIRDYKNGSRPHYMMERILKKVDKKEMKPLAEYIATLKTFVVDPLKNNQSLEGQRLFEKLRCKGCHGKRGMKGTGATPSLAGNHTIFNYLALQKFKDGRRPNKMMTPRAKKMTDDQMMAISLYLSGGKH